MHTTTGPSSKPTKKPPARKSNSVLAQSNKATKVKSYIQRGPRRNVAGLACFSPLRPIARSIRDKIYFPLLHKKKTPPVSSGNICKVDLFFAIVLQRRMWPTYHFYCPLRYRSLIPAVLSFPFGRRISTSCYGLKR